jgi:integrating conjugative element protein (TIGR03756 family)
MIKRLLICLCLILTTSAQADGSQINSGTIIKDTLFALPKCLHYHPSVHFCIWVSEWGEINTTPIVSHYLPDLVISVFTKPHDNPWMEVNKLVDSAGQPIQKTMIKSYTGLDVGSGNHTLIDQHEQNIIFKESDVVGNPALALIPEHGLLPSTATPWRPYFQSMSDSLLWRGMPPMALPEEGMAIGLNAIHHIGTGLTNWGGVYPHEGKVVSDNEVKASAVIAQRAGDLVTSRSEYGHIYKYLSSACGEHCSAAPIQENSKETYYQMIYPVTQNDCYTLGNNDSYSSSMQNPEGAYVWIVWRHYEGCTDGDGQYFGRT